MLRQSVSVVSRKIEITSRRDARVRNSAFAGFILLGTLALAATSACAQVLDTAMDAFISEHKIRPLIDRVFEFEEAPEAFEYMARGDFMGKIVIRL